LNITPVVCVSVRIFGQAAPCEVQDHAGAACPCKCAHCSSRKARAFTDAALHVHVHTRLRAWFSLCLVPVRNMPLQCGAGALFAIGAIGHWRSRSNKRIWLRRTHSVTTAPCRCSASARPLLCQCTAGVRPLSGRHQAGAVLLPCQ
jgi:hypothetical protein